MITLKIENDKFIFSGKSVNIVAEKNKLLAPLNKQIYNYALKTEILPNKSQITLAHKSTGCKRLIKNLYIDIEKDFYKRQGKYLNKSDFKTTCLKELKEKYQFSKEVDKYALEDAVDCADDAYQKFFKGAGFPKYASSKIPSGNRYTTKFTNNNIEILNIDGLYYIKLPKLGFVKIIMPKNFKYSLDEKILNVTVEKVSNRYFVSILFETVIDKDTFSKTIEKDKIYSADMGIKSLLTYGNLDTDIKIDNPKYFEVHEKRIRRLNKRLSRQIIGSKNRQKTINLLNKEYKELSNQKKGFYHKLSKIIADKTDVFICEDLNIKGILKNKHLSKEVQNVSWYMFQTFIKYKMEKKNKLFIKANRFFPSSQICNCCNFKNTDIKDLKIRYYRCPKCHTLLDRDINAKNNLLTYGYELLEKDGFIIK